MLRLKTHDYSYENCRNNVTYSYAGVEFALCVTYYSSDFLHCRDLRVFYSRAENVICNYVWTITLWISMWFHQIRFQCLAFVLVISAVVIVRVDLRQHATRRLVCRHSVSSRRPARKVDERRARPLTATFWPTRPGAPNSPTVSIFFSCRLSLGSLYNYTTTKNNCSVEQVISLF